jgi:hypothetical protein
VACTAGPTVCIAGTATSKGSESGELLREAVAAEPAVAPETTSAETLPAGEGDKTGLV